MKRTNLHLYWRDRAPLGQFRTAVSLHSHTLYSEESLAFVPRYTANVPVVSQAIEQQHRRCLASTGRGLDFGRAFWRPPLAPREAHDLERRQIAERVDADALVSLTDHDDIQAGSLLSVVDPKVPVSVEWTIPFGPSFFHLGVHNLPPARAQAIFGELKSFTARPSREQLSVLLSGLNDDRETLLVLNHPLWDEARIGAVEHAQLLGRFLERYGEHIHALELNGLRPWKENSKVRWLAEHYGHVLISGGDRHGLEPNANLNLTNAQSFSEFVAEIREDRISDVLFMPQYREPIRLRMIETMCDIVRDYPDFPIGRKCWNERVFYRSDDGTVKPLATLWRGEGPWPVKWFVRGLHALKSQPVRSALRVALTEPGEVSI
jgi:hypothetical protein